MCMTIENLSLLSLTFRVQLLGYCVLKSPNNESLYNNSRRIVVFITGPNFLQRSQKLGHLDYTDRDWWLGRKVGHQDNNACDWLASGGNALLFECIFSCRTTACYLIRFNRTNLRSVT